MQKLATIFCLLSISFTILSAQAQQTAKQILEKKALSSLQNDIEIQQLKSRGNIFFKHPVLREHRDLQTLIYTEIYLEKLADGRRREWEIIEADVRFHFDLKSNKMTTQKNIFQVKKNIDSSSFISKKQAFAIISKKLNLPQTLTDADVTLRYRLLPQQQNLIPIFWIEVKKHTMETSNDPYLRHSGRTLLVDTKTGTILSNTSRHRYEEPSKLPTVIIRDAKANKAHTFKFSESDNVSDNSKVQKDYKNYCQLISTKKDSEGTPLIVHPDRCEMVYDGKAFTKMADASAVRAKSNSSVILQFYSDKLQQWGLDFDASLPFEKRTPIVDIVHIGEHFDNAYWDEELKVMVYGDGNGGAKKEDTGDYTLALDISGHEYTHGIVSQTANFAAEDEAGALNEAFADIFGILIDRANKNYKSSWSIGKMLYHNEDGDSDEVALRSLSNPHRFKSFTFIKGVNTETPFPDKYSEKFAVGVPCNDDNDYCEVHANSTIWSHAAYLIDQNFQSKLNMSAAAADLQTAQLYFLTLTHRLHEKETMKSAAAQLIQQCDETLSKASCDIVREAIRDVELNNVSN